MRQVILLALALAVGGTAFAQSSANELDKASAILADVKSTVAPDGRQAIFTLKAYHNPDGVLVVGGEASDSAAVKAAREALADGGLEYADSIALLPYDVWAQVRIPVASLRTGGRHAAEMATQAVMGTPLRVLQKAKEWWQVQTPDGYIAWVPTSSVTEKTPAQLADWRRAKRFIVTWPYQVRAYRTAEAEGVRDVVTDLVNGSIVCTPDNQLVVTGGKALVELPDGRRGYVAAEYLGPVEEWAAQDFNADKILDTAYSMEGTPYLWGGTSTKAIDCSGLAKVSYFANGIILMRDASQQALTGTRIEAKDWRTCRAGDLLFFGNAQTGRVTHVGIYDHAGNYVHSSGLVKRNSVDPEADTYLTTPFLHAVRIHGNEETPGIVRARNHPWYF